jgi:hypothetical protein
MRNVIFSAPFPMETTMRFAHAAAGLANVRLLGIFQEPPRGDDARIFADVALVRAYKADTAGNLMFRKTARNFSPMMCMAAKVTIVEAEHIVEVGELDPDAIHVPGVYVKRIVQVTEKAGWIEQRTVRKRPAA